LKLIKDAGTAIGTSIRHGAKCASPQAAIGNYKDYSSNNKQFLSFI